MKHKYLAGLTLPLLLAACGTQNSGSSGGLTQQDAKALSEAAAADLALDGGLLADAGGSASLQATALSEGALNAIGYNLPRRVIHLLNALGAYLPPAGSGECSVTVSPANFVDADDDGVPASITVSFNCAGTRANGTSYTTEGSISLSDTDDTQALSGYSANFSGFHTVLTRDDGTVIDRSLEGSFTLDKRDASLYAIAKNYSQAVSLSVGGNTYSGSAEFKVEKTYAPELPGTPWAKGTITIARDNPGSLTWVRGGKTRNLIWYTDPTLHWNRADCASPARLLNYDSGAKEWVYTRPSGEQDTLRIEFTGCGEFTVTFNGGAVE
jgi:hypothetical protein